MMFFWRILSTSASRFINISAVNLRLATFLQNVKSYLLFGASPSQTRGPREEDGFYPAKEESDFSSSEFTIRTFFTHYRNTYKN